jgi:hypothetical protein
MSKWINVKHQTPPTGRKLLVYKHYLDEEFDVEEGFYNGKMLKTTPFICVDIALSLTGFESTFCWENGGVVTHWMELPEEPK